MGADSAGPVLLSVALILLNAWFVLAEYAIVSVRRTSIESLANRKVRNARFLLDALDNLSSYVAASQVGITMLSIATGAISERAITELLVKATGQWVDPRIGTAVGFLLVTFTMVVLGELCPKLIAIKYTDRLALAVIRPLSLFATLTKPLIWLSQRTAAILLKPLNIDVNELEKGAVARDELVLMVREGQSEGILEGGHASVISRALKFDQLDARDIMVHRLDVKWLDINLNKEQLLKRLSKIPFTRLPVCRGDIDDLAGVVYLHDVVKNINNPDFKLEAILRPAVVIPESLSIDRVLEQMRTRKTQILIVIDEYGGFSGLVTLEDVVEEVFGELEDTLESERPAIERLGVGRVSARAETRYDEIQEFLGIDTDGEPITETLATLVIDELGRIPRPGDAVESPLGILRVENMARRRITRVSIDLDPSIIESAEPLA